MEIETLHPLVRIADALESIAINLNKIANPSVVIEKPFDGITYWGGKVTDTGGKPPEMVGTIAK